MTAAPPQVLPRSAPASPFNMAAFLLDRHVEAGRGDRPAVHLIDRTVTYAQLHALANQAGNALRALGVQPEQRVAICLPDGVEFVATFLGAMKLGAVPVPLNTAATLDELRYLLTASRARILVSTAELAVAGSSASLEAILIVGEQAAPESLAGKCVPFEAALAQESNELAAYATAPDEPCYWLYSSGTTGRPKAVVHLHGDMLACVVPYAEEVVHMTPDDRTYSVARLFFSYGLVNSLFLPLAVGGSAVLLPERPVSATVLRVIRAQRPTLLFAVPTACAQLCAALESEPSVDPPLAAVRLAVSAGEPLPQALYHRWRALTGVELLDGLGSTEVGYIFCSNRPGQVTPGSSGRPIGDHELKLMDEDGLEVIGPGSPGELWVRARSTALLYWNERERTKQTFVGPWLRTGDRYRRDADGNYWHEGRLNDMFKVSGQWLSPIEVENCLLEHPAVIECAVVAALDDDRLVKPKAYVVCRPGVPVTAAELQLHVKQRLRPHSYPRWIEFIDELPKTSTGKVQRFRLR